jgi:hypothetical protein
VTSPRLSHLEHADPLRHTPVDAITQHQPNDGL